MILFSLFLYQMFLFIPVSDVSQSGNTSDTFLFIPGSLASQSGDTSDRLFGIYFCIKCFTLWGHWDTVLSLFLYQILHNLGTSVTGCFVFIPALKLSQSNMPQSINLVSHFLQWVVVVVDEMTFDFLKIKMGCSKITKLKQC